MVAGVSETGTVLGPLDLKDGVFGSGPHAVLVRDDELMIASLPGRARLWLVAIPGVLAARGLQAIVPPGVPDTLVYVGLVLLAFALGDRWSKRTTANALDELTSEELVETADTRVPFDEIMHLGRRERTFGGPELSIHTADDVHRLAGDEELVDALQRALPGEVAEE